MSSLTRSSLPQDFIDKASRVGLVQPQPAMPFARVLFAAVASAQLAKAMPMGVSASDGGVMSLEEQQLVLDPIRSQLVEVFDDYRGVGNARQTLTIDRQVYSGGGYSIEARTASAEVATSLTPLIITGETASLTLRLMEGPYGSSGTAVQPIGYAPEEVSGNPAKFGAKLFNRLNFDRLKFLDSVLNTLAEANAVHIAAGDPTDSLNGTVIATVANAAFLAAGDRPADCDMIARASALLKASNIPTFDNGRYAAFLSTKQCLDISRDPDFKRPSEMMEKTNILASAYKGSIHGVDIYEVTTLNTATNTSSVVYQKGFVLGKGALGYAPGTPCQVKMNETTNFGKQYLFIWQAVEAFCRLDSRMGVTLLSS
jgi:hypothetical protein